ncbi:MAG: hypothetical protein P8L30_05680 [Longimicrobiales bacterium]|nr:hypothetical protein [Longimicrobiales bacterium]
MAPLTNPNTSLGVAFLVGRTVWLFVVASLLSVPRAAKGQGNVNVVDSLANLVVENFAPIPFFLTVGAGFGQ